MAGEEEEDFVESQVEFEREESVPQAKAEPPRAYTRPKELYSNGPHATGYHNFVQDLFKVGDNKLKDASTTLTSYTSDISSSTNLPPSLLLKLESLSENGVDNLNTMPMWAYDTGSKFSLTPDSFDRKSLPPTKMGYGDDYASRYGNFKSEYMRNRHNHKQDDDVKPKHVLLDYKRFRSAPMSPHLYSDANYVHREDSRIVGSDFVMLTMRPNDNFLNKIDKTLAEARKINSWDM